MQELANGVWQLSGFPPNNINVYVLGDVLIDAGLGLHRRRILRQVADRNITAHALTHAHFDHYGSSHAICERLGIPLWCGAADENWRAAVNGAANVGRCASCSDPRCADPGSITGRTSTDP